MDIQKFNFLEKNSFKMNRIKIFLFSSFSIDRICLFVNRLCPPPPALGVTLFLARLHLNEFATECGWDHLYVWDGDNIFSGLKVKFTLIVFDKIQFWYINIRTWYLRNVWIQIIVICRNRNIRNLWLKMFERNLKAWKEFCSRIMYKSIVKFANVPL